METSSNCRAMASASILSPSEKLWGQREARWNPKGKARDVTWRGGRIGEVVAGAPSPAAASHTLGSKKKKKTKGPAGRSELTHHALNLSQAWTFPEWLLRDYINIYIIKYKLKKNSVKNSMWKKKCCGFLFLVSSLLLLLLLFYSWILTFLLRDELQYFSALTREVQGRRQWLDGAATLKQCCGASQRDSTL